MDRYSHTVIGEQAGALSALPDRSTVEPQQERQRATGTEAAGTTPRIPSCIPSCLPERKSSGLHRIASIGLESGARSDGERGENAGKQSVFGTSLHSIALDCSEDEEDAPKGTRTPVAGLKSRCPRPLDDGGCEMRDHSACRQRRQLAPPRARPPGGGGAVASSRRVAGCAGEPPWCQPCDAIDGGVRSAVGGRFQPPVARLPGGSHRDACADAPPTVSQRRGV
jgi:hypothetical protein